MLPATIPHYRSARQCSRYLYGIQTSASFFGLLTDNADTQQCGCAVHSMAHYVAHDRSKTANLLVMACCVVTFLSRVLLIYFNARWQRAPTRRCNSIICSLKQNKFHLRTKTRHPTLPLTPPPPDTPFTNVFLSRAMTHYWKTASQQAALHTQCAANLSAQCTTPLHHSTLPLMSLRV